MQLLFVTDGPHISGAVLVSKLFKFLDSFFVLFLIREMKMEDERIEAEKQRVIRYFMTSYLHLSSSYIMNKCLGSFNSYIYLNTILFILK